MEQVYPIVMLVIILVVFYFILIRPQKKKEKALQNMISALKVGDEIASIGGIHGKITKVKDNLVVLETGIGTTKSYVTLEKSAIARLIKEGKVKDAADADADADADSDSDSEKAE